MSRLFIVLLCLCLIAGCQTLQQKNTPSKLPQKSRPNEISTLLSARHEFCVLPDQQRAEQISIRRNSIAENQLFELLLLASCNPTLTPDLLRNTLDKLKNHAQWTQEKQALFDLILSQSQAYDRLERKYHDLKIDYESLSAKHKKLQQTLDDTIKGIKQIESDMETIREHEKSDDK